MKSVLLLATTLLITSCFNHNPVDEMNKINCGEICNESNGNAPSNEEIIKREIYIINVKSDKTFFELLDTHPFKNLESDHQVLNPTVFILPESSKGKLINIYSVGSYNSSNYVWGVQGYEGAVRISAIFLDQDMNALPLGEGTFNIFSTRQTIGVNDNFAIPEEAFTLSASQGQISQVIIPQNAYAISFSPADTFIFDNFDKTEDLKVVVRIDNALEKKFIQQHHIIPNKTFFTLSEEDQHNAVADATSILLSSTAKNRWLELTVEGDFADSNLGVGNAKYAAVIFTDGHSSIKINEKENSENENFLPGLDASFKIPQNSIIISNNPNKKTRIKIPDNALFMKVSAVDKNFHDNSDLDANFVLHINSK
jgi:hypothetical protein